MSPTVSIGLVTWNSADVLERCLEAIRAQTHVPLELLVVDNGSQDATRDILARSQGLTQRILLDRNTGYSAAHNLAIRRARGEYYLSLNPDVFMSASFVATLVAAISANPRYGAATGKLLRADDPRLIDSAGIYLVASQRHLDRGAGELDTDRFNRGELVFGASGAAALYRREMLDDLTVDGEVFDEDFFAYREDADLAWRAQLYGWRCVYVPAATALHVRRVTPERRGALPPELNRMSVRNRFLLRVKNQPVAQFLRFLAPAMLRDLQVVGYVLVREHRSLPAFVDLARLLPRALKKRRTIMARRRASLRELNSWFSHHAKPLDPS